MHWARRFRTPLAAVVLLVFSAGVAFAARPMPEAAAHGLETAEEASGQAVPIGRLVDEPAAVTEEVEGLDLTDDEQGNENVDQNNHGALVSKAARMTEPEGFRNHGQFVSCVARLDVTGAEPVDLDGLAAEDCDRAEAGDDESAATDPAATNKVGQRAKDVSGVGKDQASRAHKSGERGKGNNK